ncbi:Helix-turn-helix protein [Tenacibaculum sp. 190524A02b]|uniref:Helix-turn-helix protein n=1 Tax=Tenacibaculum vairaonense TaxID=3137860 RepID=A0ABM9PSF3_9FLAO
MSFFLKRVFYFIIFVSITLSNYAQKKTNIIDSLTQKSFKELADLFYGDKPSELKPIVYAKAYFNKAIKEKDTMKMLNGKYFLADVKKNDSIYLNFCDSLIKLTKIFTSKNFPSAIYLDKSKFYFNNRKNSNALKELILVTKQLKKVKNDSLQKLTNFLYGAIKYSVKDYNKSLFFFKKIYNRANFQDITKNPDLITLPLNLALVYKKLNYLDSALIFNNKAINLYRQIGDSLNLNYSLYVKGDIQFDQQRFLEAIKSFKVTLNFINKDNNRRILSDIYTKIGIASDSINNNSNAYKFHLKTDSIVSLSNMYTRYTQDSYLFLMKYYENKQDLEKKLTYINKLLKVKDFHFNEREKINKIFTEEYDIPNLLEEKKKIINQLETKVQQSKRNKITYLSLLALTVLLIVYQIQKKRTYKKRFLALVEKEQLLIKKSITKEKSGTKNNISLPEEVIKNILEKLNQFEQKEAFLSSSINLQKLATKLNTNANYLSKVINQHKHSNFKNYINKLRVDYTVQRLKKDPKWRKYTIKAIANEVGFKNAESFSKAFYRYTELKPSYFIKELEKSKVDN